MEPGVPFALLGIVELLSVAAWVALAGAAVALRRGRFAVLLTVVGALVLAGAEVATALRFGDTTSDALAVVRTAGALLLGAGLLNGAFGAGTTAPPAASALPGVIVPLASAPAPALLAGASTAVAAVAALRARRDLVGGLLAAALAASAAALVLSPRADDSADGTLVVVLLRGLGAVLLLAALVRLARVSLLAKVVAAILGGVLAASAAALGVVGTVVVTSYQDQSNDVVADAARDRLAALSRVADAARVVAIVAPTTCPARCPEVLQLFTSDETSGDFVARVSRTGAVTNLGGRKPLTSSERLGLARDPTVQAALHPRVRNNEVLTGRTRLVGSPPSLAVIAIKADAPVAPESAVVYGVRLDDTYTANDVEGSVTLGLSFLVDGRVVASNLSGSDRRTIDTIARREDIGGGFSSDSGRTVPAQGTQPTVHFQPVTAPDGSVLGVIALSRDATDALQAQQRALTLLFATALLATALVGGLALLLGRRTVDPVRRLTAAAARVSAGDLTATADVRSADEVGTLSRTFDTMTGSLSQLTDELRAAATRLQTVLTSMSDGLVATDAEGRVTSINPAALEMVGLASEAEALGRPLADVVDVRDAGGQPLADPSRRLLDAAGEVHRADADDTVPVRVALAPLDSGDGVVLVLRDTTREREVERMKTEFLSNVSHELRTPLTPIRGYAEILVAKPDLTPDKVATFATTIRDESVKMNRVVDLLVDVAAIEAGRVQIVPRPVAVKDLLDSRLAAWKERAPDRAKDFKRRVGAGLPPVLVDPQWVGKALDELVDNAVKYTPPGTPITFVAALHDTAVRVGVHDKGPGIAEVDQRTLFTSFEQVDGSATRRVGGLGLGLSFVRRLAEDAGFPLAVSSVVGKGSEFSLDLPVSDQPVPRPERRTSPRSASRAARRPAPARGRDR